MEDIQIKKLTAENIADEHICCAFSDKKCREGYNAKKEWLKEQFKDGYVFKKLDVRGKVFIEYVPVENGWTPINAPNYMLVNCFWVSGKYKKRGFGKQLFEECVNDAILQEKDGIVVVVAEKKEPFMSEKKFFQKQGFMMSDTAKPYFELWYKPLTENALIPTFKSITKNGTCDKEQGISVYYTNACPFTEYYVNAELARLAKERALDLHITKLTREEAQNHFVPHTIYSLFYNGKFVTQRILNKTSFDKFIKKNQSDI